MIIIIKEPIVKALKSDLEKLDIIQLDKDGDIATKGSRHGRYEFGYHDGKIDLTALTKKETEKLAVLLETCNVHGCKIAAADVRKYLRASKDGITSIRARTVRQAAWMLEKFFAELPHHIIFSKDEYGGNSHSGYYVEDIIHQPEQPGTRHQNYQPAFNRIDLYHIENDIRESSTLTLYAEDCLEMTCLEILAHKGYVPESPKLLEVLRKETEAYYDMVEKIGKQYIATGLGVCDLDNALKTDDRHRRRTKIELEHFGKTNVVIDVYKEKDTEREERERDDSINAHRWHNWNSRYHSPSEDELVRHLNADEDTAEPCNVEVPVHPLVPCFDLRRHVRLRVHVNNLTSYKYDRSVADKLILPERDLQMVNLLVDHSSNTFRDIVANKGQSMNILSEGAPGTGKTLTAEIFAEFKQRPLYTIQCSQLGMDASDVEHNLSVIMRRANRWDAVLLLDEADVYIRKRNTDMTQNAIVGAFLRVLEYASCILFMTTNLKNQVDDAITSRCIARLSYECPSADDQAKIWRILADLNKLDLPDKEITKIVQKHPHLSGRDVKNLLKLASFVAESTKKPLDAKAIEYALQFKPTETFS